MLLDSGLMIKDAWFLLLRQFTLSKKCLLFWRFSSLNRFKWLVPSDIAGSIRTPHRSFRNIITQGLDFIQKGLKLVTFSKICTVGNCHPQNSPLRFKRSDKRGLPFQCPLEILLNQPRFTMVNISVVGPLAWWHDIMILYFTFAAVATHFRLPVQLQGLTLFGPHPTRYWRVGSAWEAALRRIGPQCLTGGLREVWITSPKLSDFG